MTAETTMAPLSEEQVAEFRRACANKFLVDLGGEIRLGRGELLQLLDAYEANAQLRAECVMLARLAADTPQFHNPLIAREAMSVRDKYLAGAPR